MKAVLTPRALREFAAAAGWISEDSPQAAKRFRAAMDEALTRLGDQPMIGSIRPDLAPQSYRFWLIRRFSYVLVYDADARPPQILRIVHAARNLPDLLTDLRSGQNT